MSDLELVVNRLDRLTLEQSKPLVFIICSVIDIVLIATETDLGHCGSFTCLSLPSCLPLFIWGGRGFTTQPRLAPDSYLGFLWFQACTPTPSCFFPEIPSNCRQGDRKKVPVVLVPCSSELQGFLRVKACCWARKSSVEKGVQESTLNLINPRCRGFILFAG